MLDLIPLVILAFASFRITRFLVIDTLISGARNKFHSFLVNRAQKNNKILHFVWEKVYELTSCTWCSGFWVSAALYTLYVWVNPLDFSRLDVLNIFAIAGIQGMLHAYEPGDE